MNLSIIFNILADTTQVVQEVTERVTQEVSQPIQAVDTTLSTANQVTQVVDQATHNVDQMIQPVEQVANTVGQTPVSTEFGMMHLILHQGDWVLRAAFILMLLMSILSWTIIIYRTFSYWSVGVKMKRHLNLLNSDQYQSYEQIVQQMNGSSPIKMMLLSAIHAKGHINKSGNPFSASLNYSEYLMRSIRHSLDTSLNARDGGLTVLASIGATAPFVGLFGTVWGIYHALINIATMGNVNIATISGPIGEALIATAFGLFVAIPAVLAYNALNRSNRVLGRRLDSFAHDLYNSFLKTQDKE